MLLAFAAVLREPILGLVALGIAIVGLILRLWWDHALVGEAGDARPSFAR